jgi:hypothetical protein
MRLSCPRMSIPRRFDLPGSRRRFLGRLQRIMIVRIENYVCLVPYIETKECVLLKTIIPSRKATKKYLGRQGDMNEADQ